VKEHDFVLGLAYVNKNFVQSRFAVGDRVRVYYPRRVKGRSVKWQSFFSIDGRVERRINDVTYLVKADRWRGSKVVHVDKIKPLLTFQPV